MRADRVRRARRAPSRARPPSDKAPPPLQDDDVVEDERLRGVVVRAGAEIAAALWED
ncbi:MAG: hypothetical protein QME71_02085 [Dehalococcoidia bacterium]|nr:hypothetical protein [Dehalococcoidia bacterium]